MTLTDEYLKDLNAPLRAESYPELPQDIAEIDTEVTIPLLKNAVEVIKHCCELHCQKCEECPLARMIWLGATVVPICRCAGMPKQWDVIHK